MKDEKNTQSYEFELQDIAQEGTDEGTETEKSLVDPLNEESHEGNGSEDDYFDHEPVEIHLNDEDFKKYSESHVSEDDDGTSDSFDASGEKGKGLKKKKKKTPKKIPDETVLQERSIISFVCGLLSCSVFMGNPIFALIGIGAALSTKRYKHKSIYSTIGILAGIFGLALSLLFVLVPILAFVFIVLLIVALGLLEIFLLLIAVVLLLIINPMIDLLVQFLVSLIIPSTLCAAFLL